MSLNVQWLEKARALANGIVQARCPACAEGGNDRAGEHLRVYPDGRFGCCVHPKDREHRKRIFALAGDRQPRSFTVKVASGKAAASPAQSVAAALGGFRGTLGTAVSKSAENEPDSPQNSGTLGTPVLDSVASEPALQGEFGTLGTASLMSRACAREEEVIRYDHAHTCKDNDEGVPSVPRPIRAARMPHVLADGTLVISFESPARFHWWKGGQSIAETRAEVERGFADAERKESNAAAV